MKDMVYQRALDRAKLEGLDQHERVTQQGSEFHNKLQDYAMMKLAFYECTQCHLPYYGGQRDCQAELAQQNAEEEKKEEVKVEEHQKEP